MSLTVSLIAVFIPLLFMTGVVGRLFKEFAVTLSIAVVVSAVVSLTLTPMMCGRILRPATRRTPGPHRAHQRGRLQRAARRLSAQPGLDVRHQRFVLLVGVATLVGTIVLYIVVPKGFLPQQDTGVLIAVTEAAQSASIPRLVALQTAGRADRRARSRR